MPQVYLEDTIAAIATPPGEGGISVIRLSGPDAWSVVGAVFKAANFKDAENFESHYVYYGAILSKDGEMIDRVLVSFFKNPHSYTGEDTVEISCHGGLTVTRLILDRVLYEGVRHAEPGEFTKRAFLNGKIDLSQAEAVADVIHAKSSRALDIAMNQLEGALSRPVNILKEHLMKLYANMEAYLDFPDEDLEIDIREGMKNQLQEVKEKIESLIAGFKRNELIREGLLISFLGKPNVGKSSLFNSLLDRDRALVSDLPNTTRDQLEESVEIGGFWVRLMDTAGLVSTPEHPLDEMGMKRTEEALNKSHVVLFAVDGSRPLEETDRFVFDKIPSEKTVICLMNKSDLGSDLQDGEILKWRENIEVVRISALTKEGFEKLENSIQKYLESQSSEAGEQITKLRHKNALDVALKAVGKAEKSYNNELSFEFVVEDLKEAIAALQEIIGEVYSEDLLDVVFKEFCIGK